MHRHDTLNKYHHFHAELPHTENKMKDILKSGRHSSLKQNASYTQALSEHR